MLSTNTINTGTTDKQNSIDLTLTDEFASVNCSYCLSMCAHMAKSQWTCFTATNKVRHLDEYIHYGSKPSDNVLDVALNHSALNFAVEGIHLEATENPI